MSTNKPEDTIDWFRPLVVGPCYILPVRSWADPFDPARDRCDGPGCPLRAEFFCPDCNGAFCTRCLAFHDCSAMPEIVMPDEDIPNGPRQGLRALVEAARRRRAEPPFVSYTQEAFLRDAIGRVMEIGTPMDRAFDYEAERHIEIGKDHHG